jgi:signal peptidase II
VARRSLVLPLVLIAVAVLAVDQATKVWALGALTPGERTPLLGDLLGLSLVRNSGAALGIASGTTWVFTVAAVVVTVIVLRVARRLGSRGWAVALGLLLGGAVGNLVDRLVREPGVGVGHVIDFIAYADWFVGNVADVAIVVAAGLMMLLGLRGIGLDGTRHTDAPDDAGDAPADDAADDAAADGTAGAAGDTADDAAVCDGAPESTDEAGAGEDAAPAEAADRR